MDRRYTDAVALLLDAMPLVFVHKCFALKGGTAINLYCRDMPRLSVDIDLVFIDDAELPQRAEALAVIESSLKQVSAELQKRLNVKVHATASGSAQENKLFVSRGATLVKIEVNHVFRGSVYPVVEGHLTPAAEDLFEREVTVPMLDIDELYASKVVAALDRQHPRDLFDIMLLNENGGITPRMRRAFVVYLAGHNRPMHELLPPLPHSMVEAFEREFVGMTSRNVAIEELEETRAQLFAKLPAALDDGERRFLISLHRLEPDWSLLGLPGIEHLPAITWKLKNLEILKSKNPAKFHEMQSVLEQRLGGV